MENNKEEGLQIKISLNGKEYTLDEARVLYTKLKEVFEKNTYYYYPNDYNKYLGEPYKYPLVTYAVSKYSE